MIALLLAIISSSMISVLMRVSSDKAGGNLSMLSVNYLICMAFGAGYAGFALLLPQEPGFFAAAGLGVVNGVLFLASFITLQVNVQKNGVVLSSVFMKLGLLVPIALSVLLFREVPTWMQAAGFCLAIGAIVLINLKDDGQSKGVNAGLILLLLLGGSADAMAKVFERLGTAEFTDLFLFYTFAVAFVLCTGLAAMKKERPGAMELIFGALIGVPNFFSSKFLIAALTQLPAVVVYPTFSVATILLVTLAGVCVFKERLCKRQRIALAVIIGALALLNT